MRECDSIIPTEKNNHRAAQVSAITDAFARKSNNSTLIVLNELDNLIQCKNTLRNYGKYIPP
jgi:hypothetical protein